MKYFSIILLFLFILTSGHSVIISEIHANPEGNDKDREWLEIFNDGETIDLKDWKFFEQDTNHGLKVFTGDWILEKSDYAIIALNPLNFLDENPLFSGTVYDSSWGSLKNTGEFIALKDDQGEIIDIINYIEVEEGKSVCRNLENPDEGFECDPSPGFGLNEESEVEEEIPETEPLEEKQETEQTEPEEELNEEKIEEIPEQIEEQKIEQEPPQIQEEIIKETTETVQDESKVELIFTEKLEFNRDFNAQIKAENVENAFVHVEDSSKKKISESARFYGENFEEEFTIFIFSGCDSEFLDPFYLTIYFGEKVLREKLEFVEEKCTKDIEDVENLEERFPEEITGELTQENIFQKIWNFLVNLFR